MHCNRQWAGQSFQTDIKIQCSYRRYMWKTQTHHHLGSWKVGHDHLHGISSHHKHWTLSKWECGNFEECNGVQETANGVATCAEEVPQESLWSVSSSLCVSGFSSVQRKNFRLGALPDETTLSWFDVLSPLWCCGCVVGEHPSKSLKCMSMQPLIMLPSIGQTITTRPPWACNMRLLAFTQKKIEPSKNITSAWGQPMEVLTQWLCSKPTLSQSDFRHLAGKSSSVTMWSWDPKTRRVAEIQYAMVKRIWKIPAVGYQYSKPSKADFCRQVCRWGFFICTRTGLASEQKQPHTTTTYLHHHS